MFKKEIFLSFSNFLLLTLIFLLPLTLRCQSPSPLPQFPPAAPARPALTDKYPDDRGMEKDSDVLYIENFEDSLGTIRARYSDVLNPEGMSLEPDVPPGSHGRYSLKITNIGGQNTGGHLFRKLSPGLDGTIYVRYYVKYPRISSTYIHHEGLWIGGYSPPTTYPDPRAGSCGLDGRLSIAYEPSNHDSILGTYLYWSGMKSWNGGSSCYGNDILHDGSHHLVWDRWTCVEMMIKLNDPVTASNGELEIWQDGVEVGHWGPGFPRGRWVKDTWIRNPADPPFEGFRWRKDASLDINYLWIEFYDDASPAGATHYIQYDHLVIARSYIGPLRTANARTSIAPPRTPAVRKWDPASSAFPVLEGQAWPGNSANPYGRLPAEAKDKVRKEVWDLSQDPAGMRFRFRTNAPAITVTYQVAGALQFPHMPATGVSGIDLYAKDTGPGPAGRHWLWCGAKYSFGDTITYRFHDLAPGTAKDSTREYTLDLPLYNRVKWLELSVPEESRFEPLPARKNKPIVIYGTSIAQGGCASRPGMAWTAILQRNLDMPVINLGFSGNGRLENEVLEYITQVDARLYVLDCLPNLVPPAFPAAEIKKRLVAAIKMLHTSHPAAPILLAEHAGYTDEGTNAVRKEQYRQANTALRETFDSLQKAGMTHLYLIPKKDFDLDIDATVDGTHPNDLGMLRYAEAYEKKIRRILALTR